MPGIIGSMIQVVKKDSNTVQDVLHEPIAIIGMNCQFPGMDSDVEEVTAFYDMLLQGQTPVKEVPENRWNINGHYDVDQNQKNTTPHQVGGFLKNPQLFDNDFFKIAPAEAKQIDPQQRLFLEVSIRALNHANIRLDSLNHSATGVFCGISSNDYSQLNYKDNIQFNEYTQIGAANSAAAGRLCHFLNLKGPSMAVDTACSSSLTALYVAALALRNQQCDMAIVGGVQLNLCPEPYIGLSKAKMLSPTGQCSSFDSTADGYIRSEGCGVVIVKRLSDAIKDGNKIHALIKNIVMNQDGAGTSLVAPNLQAQIALHKANIEQAGLTASDIDYIEPHGTGTVLGDLIELQAIQTVHQGQHSKENPLIIGALKSNLGHTLSVSGIASLIKAVIAFEKETIPPNLHYSSPNKSIDPECIPAILPTKITAFARNKNKKRYAQITNFGFTGTNMSVLIEEPLPFKSENTETDNQAEKCFILSANSEQSLNNMLENFSCFLKKSTINMHDVCCTLINCRDHFKYRCAIMADDQSSLINTIENADYEIKKVAIKKEHQYIEYDAQQIHESFMSGLNISLTPGKTTYNKTDLPLYSFDRKPYWHEHSTHWLDTLYQQTKEQQIDTIKAKVLEQLSLLLGKESLNEYQDVESQGLTNELKEQLDRALFDQFSPRYKIPASLMSPSITPDKMARHLQQKIMPAAVTRQPVVQVLDREPIAIIGMSCRFPKAGNIDEFLSLLERGGSGMSDIPLERWDNDTYYDADKDAPGRLYIKQLGLMDEIKKFDADFFNFSPREAKFMAPQLRIFMESSFHALEHANLPLDKIKDSNTGVFVGVGTNEYPRVLLSQGLSLDDLNIYFATGNVLNAIAGRVAYAFDFHGPIQAIDTACSSSLTAIHNACQSLQAGDCAMALAGGVNVLLSPESNVTLSKARMLSPESRCKTFSDDADGYARSEGCGVLVLKRLSTAIKDKDTIFALIKGSSINSDGKSGGFTVPNGTAQEEVIRSALAKAELQPKDIDYIEAHGTGTPLADPIEFNTLTRIFGTHHSPEKPLYVSSVKTNIGHCESASGVAGVIKAVLSVHTRKLFKHLNFNKLNPGIDLKNTVIPLKTMDWPKEEKLKCVGVSSFGFSGANAHVILQQSPEQTDEIRTLPQHALLVLSAKSKPALELLLSSYQQFLSHTQEDFADICFTAATCRTHFLFRVAIQANSAQEAASLIANNQCTIHQLKKEKETAEQVTTLEQMQRAYLEGYALSWSDVYNALPYQFKKVQLPLYEFARKEHWVETPNKQNDTSLPKNWSYQLQWQPQAVITKNSGQQDGKWLLIGPEQLATDLTAQGLELTTEQEPINNHLSGIIFAEGFDLPMLQDSEASIEYQKKSIKKLLHLLKELNQQKLNVKLIILTTNALAGLASGPLNLRHSPLIGFCKTLALELPQLQSMLLDFDAPKDSQLGIQISNEIKHNHGQHYEQMIAYRKGVRLIPRIKHLVLPEKKHNISGEGRYLITGGCGGLGLVTAQALLSSGAKELVLGARNIDKPEIKTALKNLQDHYPNRTIRLLSMDVSDKNRLAKLLSELNADGLLKGIIHAAGTAIKASLLEHQDQDVDSLFSAKVKGAWYLHELSQSYSLDFFVVFSSISSVFGSNKESVYSATNSFVDALIAERQRLGLVGTAIQWGPWGEVGMANKRARDPNLKHALITNQQGQAFVNALIHAPREQAIIISPQYLKFMLDFVPQPLPSFYKELAQDLHALTAKTPQGMENEQLSPWLNQYLQMNKEYRLNACKDLICTICRSILEVSETTELEENEGFFEIGFDSLMVAELASELKKKLQPTLKIMVNIGFDHPSINKLTQHIHTELNTALPANQEPIASIQDEDDDIAIIGMSCSLPGAPDIASFEYLLENGLSGIKEIPLERWDNSKYYDPDMDAPSKSYVKKMGLMEGIKKFDASFFGISPREAKLLEPQQRLFLEGCYHALEHANYPASVLRGSLTGVFAGVGPNEYYAQLEKSGFSNEELSAYSITGNVLNLIPGRVAYTFDFKGPSLSIDTACSSSLVAVHYACQSLKNRETDYALAGGVNVLLMPESNITLCKAKALSPDGLCKTFDKRADGYARAEGCAVVVLKRLADALRDGDQILAVIKASAVNNDGKSAGITVPNGTSQEEVMLQALSHSNLANTDISYIEAHGTGTPLGDPIEVHAINKVYGNGRNKENPLYLGTVKTNIGHLESASGIASMIKTIISLQKKKIYKHLNFNQLNPHIRLDETKISLQTIHWPDNGTLKCAGINAFGFSGTNAHLILQEIPHEADEKQLDSIEPQALILSAKSPIALQQLAKQYQQYLQTADYAFADVCYTAATCREHFNYRLVLIAHSAIEASQLIQSETFALSETQSSAPALPHHQELSSLLTQYLQGETIDWHAYYQKTGSNVKKVKIPNYTFNRIEYWPDKKKEQTANKELVHPLLGQMLSLPNNEYLFHQQLNWENLSYIKQHRVFAKIIVPATAYIESGLAICKLLFGPAVFCIEQFSIERPLHPKQEQEYQVQVKPLSDYQYKVLIFAKQENNWQLFSQMIIHSNATAVPEFIVIDELKAHFGTKVDLAHIYDYFNKKSLFYGEEFQVLQEGYIKPNSILAKIALTPKSQKQNYHFHPILLDGAIQSILLLSKDSQDNSTYVPYTFKKMLSYQAAPGTIWVYLTQIASGTDHELCFDIRMFDDAGMQVALIEELRLRKVSPAHFVSYEACLHHLYYTHWDALDIPKSVQKKSPEFTVICTDPLKAKAILGTLDYQLIEEVHQLETLKPEYILFLFEQGQFLELVHCCQILFQLQPKCFVLITENAYAISEKDTVNPYHTMAVSFWKSFRNELGLQQNIAIDLGGTHTHLMPLIQHLFNTTSRENQFAVRDKIYIPRLKKKHLALQPKELFDPQANYLITGGTGGVAHYLIDYLIRKGVKHIIISSSSPCPEDSKTLIEKAKQQQVSIQHVIADASNYQRMEQLIEQINQDAQPLKGVFHLAGVVHDGLLINLNDDDFQRVLSAKMDGALILHQVTKKCPLELFVLFSSSASLLGAKGQSNYAAANGFLDGLAHLRKAQGLPALTVNWGPFNDTGMTKHLTQALEQHGFNLLDKDSIDVLDVLLSNPITQIAPCPINWDKYGKHSANQAECSDLFRSPVTSNQQFLQTLRQQTKEKRVALLSQSLREIVTQVLDLDAPEQIKINDDLFSMGMDSLMSIEIRNRIHDKLQSPSLSLSIEYFINTPTITKIADKIADELDSFFASPASTTILTEENIALCDFQYLFWAINKIGSDFNIGMQLQLHGALNKEFVYQAFDFVIQQNSALWIQFNKNTPTQKLNRAGQFKITYRDISLENEHYDLQKVFYKNLMSPIPLMEQPLVRVFLYKINNQLHEMHLLIPHIIVDDASIELIFSQFKKSYEALCMGKKLLPAPPQNLYFDYVKNNNMHHEKNLTDKISFWQNYNKKVNMLHFGTNNHLPDATKRSKHLRHYPIATELAEQFIEWNKIRNRNVSTGIVAACHVAFYKINRQHKIPVILIHNGREGSQYQSVVGLFSEYKRINLNLNENDLFLDFMNTIEEQLTHTAPYQKCSHFIKDSGLKGSELSIGQYLTYTWNKLTLKNQFQESKLQTIILKYYIKHLSKTMAIIKNSSFKQKLNKLFHLNLPLQKPKRLRVLLSITPSFFSKEQHNTRFADIDYSFPKHFSCMDRPISNRTLWVYFSKNQQGEYQLSINGPLTAECTDQIALEFNRFIAALLKHEKDTIAELIRQ